jgi:hypothetical protein
MSQNLKQFLQYPATYIETPGKGDVRVMVIRTRGNGNAGWIDPSSLFRTPAGGRKENGVTTIARTPADRRISLPQDSNGTGNPPGIHREYTGPAQAPGTIPETDRLFMAGR